MDIQKTLDELLRLTGETEWVEFKHNNCNPHGIGEYISALSNSGALVGRAAAYLVWGIEDKTHQVIGTTFQPQRLKVGAEALESWLQRLLNPRVDFTIHECEAFGKPVVLFEIQTANSIPVRFGGEAFIRVGSYTKKLKDYPEKERKLWRLLSSTQEDWSAQTVANASTKHLDPDAIAFARNQYRQKHPRLGADVEAWDDMAFLNKAKVCSEGKITNTALLLLGKDESSCLLSPAVAQLSWVLRDANGNSLDYQHFGLPLILSSNHILKKVRNLTVRHLPAGTLFPLEVAQYDPWVMRETLHNCIAHQDYSLRERIVLVETPDSLLFTNGGSFIPGTIENMIRSNAPPRVYRNRFLADAMVSLDMIDTIGSGILKMFRLQRQRNFPMPDFDLEKSDEVSVRLAGSILDEKYTQMLIARTDLELMDVIALDRVQKKRPLDDEAFKRLKGRKLIEGRRPNLFVSAKLAVASRDRATYIKLRAFNKAHYKAMVIAYLQEFAEATRADLDLLLVEKLSDALATNQKKQFIRNLLQEMKKEGLLTVEGTTRWAVWRMSNSLSEESNTGQ